MKKIKQVFRKIYNKTIFEFVKKVFRILDKDKRYIVYMDGGICSQMQEYAIGYYLQKKGYKVKFDISWYDNYKGEGINERKFELLKLFPGLEFEVANKKEILHYRRFFFFKTTEVSDFCNYGNLHVIPKPPIYVGGYYDLGIKTYEEFSKIFKMEDSNYNIDYSVQQLCSNLKSNKSSVGIHVRRGDMSEKGGYWKVVTPQYFINAIMKFSLTSNVFYFFSDEPEWVKESIIPILPTQTRYFINEKSKEDWIDFYILCHCNGFIGSQGSMGKYAWIRQMNRECKLVVPSDRNSIWEAMGKRYSVEMVLGE